jgi:hypothetical protein
MGIFKGLIIVPPHGTYIANGDKTIIVKSIKLNKIIGKPLLLIENKYALGIIYLGNIIPINLKQFKKERKHHLISNAERLKWWPNKTILYMYPIIKKKIYKKPIPINYPQGPQVLVNTKNIKKLNQNKKKSS